MPFTPDTVSAAAARLRETGRFKRVEVLKRFASIEDPARIMNVNDVARQAGLCRRALELRFQNLLARSPAAEIRRVRIEHAIDLLQRTNLSVATVAERSGFSSPEYMASVFRSQLATTPLHYRKQDTAG